MKETKSRPLASQSFDNLYHSASYRLLFSLRRTSGIQRVLKLVLPPGYHSLTSLWFISFVARVPKWEDIHIQWLLKVSLQWFLRQNPHFFLDLKITSIQYWFSAFVQRDFSSFWWCYVLQMMKYSQSLQFYTEKHYSEIVSQFVDGVFLPMGERLPVFT